MKITLNASDHKSGGHQKTKKEHCHADRFLKAKWGRTTGVASPGEQKESEESTNQETNWLTGF